MGKLTDDEGRVKVFGFRSGKSWKMIIAVLYYALAAFILVTSVINEFRYYKFEPIDVILVIIKYVFIFVFLFSPLIFLSDFKYTYNIPLFRNKERSKSAIGMIIVLGICYMMMQLNIYVGSNLYKSSVKEYTLKNTAQAVAPYEKKMDSDKLKVMLSSLQVAKGYKVEVATDDKFKNALVKGNYNKSLITIKSPKLVNQKKLFVRAKSYGTVNKKIVEGDWSDVKEVKIIKPKKKETQTTSEKITTNKQTKDKTKKDKNK
ncbi:MAG TPA: hypothetical protein DCR28_01375 [Eubacterium sp.]|nr:hypothetical protein [Eubacterium sp.]